MEKQFQTRILFLILLSLPVFLNLFQGQVNLWLMISTGEFFRKILDDKPFQAGLWLGGYLLKPQILILIIPALLIKRSYRALSGFMFSSLGLGLISLVIGGWSGLQRLVNLWIGYVGGLPSNYPESMMNWRMVALNINALSHSKIGWWIAIPCLILTIAIGLYIWKFPANFLSRQSAVAILGTFAATSAVAWHSHQSMSMIMIPLLLYLFSQHVLPKSSISFWVFMPPIVMLVVLILAAIVESGLLPTSFYPLLNLLSGLRGLALNIYLLWWAVMYLIRNSATS